MTPDSDNKWWLVRTKGRQEQQLAFDLSCREVAYYLPMLRTERDNQQMGIEPMFSGYLFLYGTIRDRYLSLRTNRIVQILEIDDQRSFHWDLMVVDVAVQSKLQLRVMTRMSKGDKCLIVEGAMKNLEGRVESVSDDNLWVAMYIKLLGQSVLVRVPRTRVVQVRDLECPAKSADQKAA